MTLLRHARTDDDLGPITKLVNPYGTLIACGAFTLGGDGDEVKHERWEMALEWLLSKGLLEFIGADAAGAQYMATPMGLTFLNERESNELG